MSDERIPGMARWPFVVGDLSLLVVALGLAWGAHAGKVPWSGGLALAVVLAVMAGAWMLVWPYLKEHDARTQADQQAHLADTLQQVRHLQSVAAQVTGALTHATAALEAAKGAQKDLEAFSGRLAQEQKVFLDAQHKANDAEKRTLQLELEKQRRAEEESLQVILHILDHTYALWMAAQRSGQPGLMEQLTQFRAACLDVSRRLGIVAHEAVGGEPFNPRVHQSADGSEVPEGAIVEGTLGCGYTYRGMGVRPIMVRWSPVRKPEDGGPEAGQDTAWMGTWAAGPRVDAESEVSETCSGEADLPAGQGSEGGVGPEGRAQPPLAAVESVALERIPGEDGPTDDPGEPGRNP